MPRFNLFRKLVVFNLILLIPIVVLYFYSNKTSTNVLATELTRSHTNQLIFFQDQINTNVGLLALWPNLLLQDPDISNLKHIWTYNKHLNFEQIKLMRRIQSKLNIQQSSADFVSQILIYSPSLRRVVSVNDVKEYDEQELLSSLRTKGWQVTAQDDGSYLFKIMSTPSPYLADPFDHNLVIEVQFSSQNIEKMLDEFKRDGRRDPFYYHADTGYLIYNRTADRELARQLVEHLDMSDGLPIKNEIVNIENNKYMVHVVLSDTLGWYLVDYLPLSEVMSPIQRSNRLFYSSVIALLLMSLVTAYMLYAQVQVPLKQLIRGFNRLKNEDYTVRLKPKGRSEFSFVFRRFNSMVEQIQELFERVYLEKIHVREARLKQLQSQINPHFFYNCFSFISSMAKLQDTRAVIAMSQNLASYFRYTTRQEKEWVTVWEEMEFVRNYLEIQKLRKKRLDYTIELPEELYGWLIPRILIQPIVENAIIHGVEQKAGAGLIRITGKVEQGQATITVEDNGRGMSESEMEALGRQLAQPMDEEMGCGLWNVHQRMVLRYGNGAGVRLSRSELGGLRVDLTWSEANVLRRASDDRSLTG